MFRIKICGITGPDDAGMVARAGADAIGLNFYPRSPRFVTLERARQIVDVLPPGIVKVGLFVDAPADEIVEVHDRLGLDLIQLHGIEPPEFLLRLGGRPVMRAFRLGPGGLAPIDEYLGECRELACTPELVLLDAFVPGAPGGTGQTTDWPTARQYRDAPERPPLVLAGGLTAENVAQAIAAVRPAAIDTASGVESSPGRKERAKVEGLVRAANGAFGETAR
jgi:phosphoribosylanthranilate isomerase